MHFKDKVIINYLTHTPTGPKLGRGLVTWGTFDMSPTQFIFFSILAIEITKCPPRTFKCLIYKSLGLSHPHILVTLRVPATCEEVLIMNNIQTDAAAVP